MHLYLYCILVLYLTLQTSCQLLNVLQQNLDIDLSKRNPDNTTNSIFTYKLNLAEGNIIVTIGNATKNGFFVIQAHSFLYNISLSKTDRLIFGSYVIGTNIGLVEPSLVENTLYRYYVKLVDKSNIDVLLSVILYEEQDPIPGGCNMVYNTKIAPYQTVTYDDYMIQVDAAPALAASCDLLNSPRLDMYRMYLEEGNSDINNYFSAIKKLMTVDDIKRHARKVSDSVKHIPLRRYYSSYPGTGSVYAIIAISGNASSAYVPAVSYACDVSNWDESCVGPVSVVWKVLCAIILFMGTFMCFFGHRFFRIEMFVFGFMFGGFISYITSPFADAPSIGSTLGFTAVFGCCYGCVWLFLWWRFGIPVLSVFIPVFFTGYIIACTLFYIGLDDMRVFEDDLSYWGVLFTVVVTTMLVFLFITVFANILSCSLIGATAVIIAIDHYIGSTLHYIIINNVRRATVHNFNLAILAPPYQYKDVILTSVWVLLVVLGVMAQRRQQRGKPPFPPHRATMGDLSERVPLLIGS